METGIRICTLSKDEVYTKLYNASHSGAYISYLRGKRCQTDNAFFREISASFQFPDYFGENWNALHECLADLDWITFSKIVIVMDDFSHAFKGDDEGRQLVLRSFNYMVNSWKEEGIEVEVWLNN